MGRRFDHGNKELYSMVLQRFLCNKDQPRIGHLVTSLLCSPAEAKVYEQEQQFLKLQGNKGIDTEPSNSNVATKIERSRRSTNLQQCYNLCNILFRHINNPCVFQGHKYRPFFRKGEGLPPMSGLVQVQIIQDVISVAMFHISK